MGIYALFVFLEVVKRFEFPKALYKFPINITIIIKNRLARGVFDTFAFLPASRMTSTVTDCLALNGSTLGDCFKYRVRVLS